MAGTVAAASATLLFVLLLHKAFGDEDHDVAVEDDEPGLDDDKDVGGDAGGMEVASLLSDCLFCCRTSVGL